MTDANGRRRLWFTYASGLLTTVAFQTMNSSATWVTQYTRTFNYTSGVLTSVSDPVGTIQSYTYTSNYLSNVADGAGNRIAGFAYSSTTSGQVDLVETSRGSVGFDFASTRTGCTGNTVLYFNKANTTACSTDTDCGSGYLCGGKTGSGATGKCFQAARCLTLATPSGYKEPMVTTISTIGPGGGSCSGACADVAQYVWDTGTGITAPKGTQDPLGNYTSAKRNANGMVTQVAYGDTDADPTTTGYARTVYYLYDTTFPGRIQEVRRASDLSPSASSCSATSTTGCDRVIYSYDPTTHQLKNIDHEGFTYNASGAIVGPVGNVIAYAQDSKGRTIEIDGAVTGIKTTFSYYGSGTADPDPNRDQFLSDYKMYKDATNFLNPTVLSYDFWGNPTGVTDPVGVPTCDTYDASRNYRTSRRRTMGGQRDCATTNAADLITSWARDSANRLTQLTRPDGSCVFYTYDTSGRPNQVKRRDDCVAANAGETQQYTYTADGLVSELDTYNAAGTLTAKQPYTYYNSRRLQNIIDPANTSVFTGYLYDSRGLLSEVDGAGSLSKEVEHYSTGVGTPGTEGRVTSVERFKTSTLSDTWSLLYSWQGEQDQVTDGDSKATGSTRDDFNRLVKLTSPDFTGPTYRIYDAGGRLTTIVEDHGGGASQQTHTFTFDNMSRPLNDDYQGSCPTTGTPHPEVQRAYDGLPPGVSTCPRAKGCQNLRGRLAWVETTLMCSSAYTSTDGAVDQFTYFSYDLSGHLIEEYTTDDTGRVADTLYGYTKGRLTDALTPWGDDIVWTYGSAGNNSDSDRITAIYDGDAGPTIDSVQWNPFGPWAQYNWKATIGGTALRSRVARDLAYRITNVYEAEFQTGSASNDQITIARDAMGRVTQRVYAPHNPTLPGLYDSYFLYDEQSRVLCETTDLQTTCPTTGANIKNNHSLSPPFMAAGDWKRILRPVPGSTGLTNDFNSSGSTYGTSHQITDVNQSDGTPIEGHTAMAYDVRGNRQYDDNTTTLTHDRRDYTYDGRRNLINVRGQYKTGGVWHLKHPLI